METEIIINKAKEAIYQVKYYKNLYLAHKKINKILLLIISTINNCLIAFHVFLFKNLINL